MSDQPPLSHTVAGAVVGSVVASVAPEVYRDFKMGVRNLWDKFQERRELNRLRKRTKELEGQ